MITCPRCGSEDWDFEALGKARCGSGHTWDQAPAYPGTFVRPGHPGDMNDIERWPGADPEDATSAPAAVITVSGQTRLTAEMMLTWTGTDRGGQPGQGTMVAYGWDLARRLARMADAGWRQVTLAQYGQTLATMTQEAA